jgi:hypothetical protein
VRRQPSFGRSSRHGFLPPFGLILVALFGLFPVLSAVDATEAEAAILPPGNPAVNIVPGSSTWLVATNQARAQEGVGALPTSLGAFDALSTSEQIFVVINLERVGRGEAPFAAMTNQLDSYAQAGAAGDTDPSHPSVLAGGAQALQSGSIWAGGTSSVLFANYLWMYEDGWGGSWTSTTNADCTSPGAQGCWAHRDIILKQFSSAYCGGHTPVLSMGVGDTGPGSVAAVLVSSCSPPSDPVFTWGEAEAALGGDGPPAAASASPSVPAYGAYSEKQLLANTSPTAVVDITANEAGRGYWLAAADGAVFGYGDAPIYGSMLGAGLSAPIVGIDATPDGRGYWLVGADGGIFSYGDAQYYGSTGAVRLNAPIVGMAATPDGKGYWLVASDGGIFSYGDAQFHGSMGGHPLNQPVVGMTVDPQTGGYWEVATDGGIFAFGAPFSGSTGNETLNAPIVGIQASPSGHGYRMDATDGGVFSFSLPFLGSMGGQPLASPAMGIATDPQTGGYWEVAADGGVFAFGAPYLGSDA